VISQFCRLDNAVEFSLDSFVIPELQKNKKK
jgi:hypothetical protein